MSYACDNLEKLNYKIRYGHVELPGTITLPNKPYGECCLKLGDLAREANSLFNIPLENMKLTWTHKPIMSDYESQKNIKISSLRTSKLTGKFNVYGANAECCAESQDLKLLRSLEVSYEKFNSRVTQLLESTQDLEHCQRRVSFSHHCRSLYQQRWSLVEEEALQLTHNLRNIVKTARDLQFHPIDKPSAERRVHRLTRRCTNSLRHCSLIQELTKQTYVKCHTSKRPAIRNTTKIW